MMERWELPKGWKFIQLHDLCTQITDGTHKTPEYRKNGIRFISIQNLRRFAPIDWDAYVRFISLEEHANLIKRVRPEKGDVLVSKIGTLGIAKVIDFDEEVSIFVGLALLKPKRQKIDSKFLEAVLNSPAYVQLAYEKARGAGRKTLPLVELKKFPIPIPYPDDPARSLAEQRRIAARLETLLSETREMREEVQAMRRDLAQVMESALAEAFPAPQGEVAQGWGWKKLKTLITVNYGKGLSEKLRLGGNVPVYGANGVVGFHNASITKGQTIVIGRKGSAGAVNWSEIACWPIDTTFFIDEFPEILYPKFLYQFLRSQQIDRLQQSAAIPGLNRDVLYSVEVPIPYPNDPARSLAEQRRIVASLERIAEETRALDASLAQDLRDLEALEQSILAAAFRGEV